MRNCSLTQSKFAPSIKGSLYSGVRHLKHANAETDSKEYNLIEVRYMLKVIQFSSLFSTNFVATFGANGF